VEHRIRIGVSLILLSCMPSTQGQIFRWTDADGQVHFGDRTPSATTAAAQDISATYEGHIPFHFEIIPVGYDMPAQTRTKVEVAVSKIHELYRSRLHTRFPSNPSFDIRIFNDEKSFSQYGEGPVLRGRASGYFSPQRNEAVTWRQRSFAQMLEVITHEANHALMHHLFGVVPPWLNEGISEYVERMEVFGQTVVIPPNRRWDALIRTKVRGGTIMPLRDYLTLEQADWRLHNLADNGSYAQAWSLIYFLMSSPDGTQLLGHLLDVLGREGADNFSPLDVIDASYDGGFSALETAWRSFVFSQKQPHQY
jgi:hypothetical protein